MTAPVEGAPVLTKLPRPILTRRKRLELVRWHLRVAWGHLWSILRGR